MRKNAWISRYTPEKCVYVRMYVRIRTHKYHTCSIEKWMNGFLFQQKSEKLTKWRNNVMKLDVCVREMTNMHARRCSMFSYLMLVCIREFTGTIMTYFYIFNRNWSKDPKNERNMEQVVRHMKWWMIEICWLASCQKNIHDVTKYHETYVFFRIVCNIYQIFNS